MIENEVTAGDEAASPAVVRYAACVQYDGSRYHGWQSLKSGLPTVQAAVEKGLGKVANHPVDVVCAGRTDRGVHGVNQIIHFDTHAVRRDRSWVLGANSNLPDDISLAWVKPVSSDFHARYSAKWRRYRYIILNDEVRPAHMPKGVTWYHRPLDAELMNHAASHLVGEHDFTSYRAVQCQARHAVREIQRIHVKRYGAFVVIDVQANAFLHHMVRNITGVLMAVGSGKAEPLWSKQVLEARDRTQAGVTAPPNGLYFVAVGYGSDVELPSRPLGPWFLQGVMPE